MPLYEYHCEACAEEFEELVRVDTPTESITCPRCGEQRARRLLSLFSGRTNSGWRSTPSPRPAANCGSSGFG